MMNGHRWRRIHGQVEELFDSLIDGVVDKALFGRRMHGQVAEFLDFFFFDGAVVEAFFGRQNCFFEIVHSWPRVTFEFSVVVKNGVTIFYVSANNSKFRSSAFNLKMFADEVQL